MRPVGVHLNEKLSTFGKSDAKRIFIRGSDPELAVPVQHPHSVVGTGETVRDLTRAIGR